MSFHYDPMSKEQAESERFELLKDGYYSATVFDSVDKVSSTGNSMMEIFFKVYDEQGKPHNVRSFLVFTPKMMWKTIHFAEATSLLTEYSQGKFCSNLIKDKNVRVLIGTEKGKEIPVDKLNGKPYGSCYPDKNIIHDFTSVEERAPQAIPADFKDDEEIPF